MTNDKIEQLRKEYRGQVLRRNDLNENPIQQFQKWLDLAIQDQLFEPHAMTLSTIGLDGRPNSRTVLLKDIFNDHLVFVTNSLSLKGQELAENPYASLTFWFREHYRQVTFRGEVQILSEEKSQEYFRIRPRGSQIAAWIPQSEPIENRSFLDQQFEKLEKNFSSFTEIPCPHSWSAYSLNPYYCEFWQGRENRLHDRFSYTKQESSWNIQRLTP